MRRLSTRGARTSIGSRPCRDRARPGMRLAHHRPQALLVPFPGQTGQITAPIGDSAATASIATTAPRPICLDVSTSGTGRTDIRAFLMVSFATSGRSRCRARAYANVDFPLAGGADTTTNSASATLGRTTTATQRSGTCAGWPIRTALGGSGALPSLAVAESACVFCSLAAASDDDLVIFDDGTWFVLPGLLQRPGNLGHVIVAPKAHYQDLFALPPEQDAALLRIVRRVADAVGRAFAASGTTIRQNNGPPGQDVFDLHVDVIPRSIAATDMTGEQIRLPDADRAILAHTVRQHLQS
jgi:histidine triad (HIT) family protein